MKHVGVPSLSYNTISGKLNLMLFVGVLFATLSCKGEFGGGEKGGGDGKGTEAQEPKILADGKYKIKSDASGVQGTQAAAVTTSGVEPDPSTQKQDKLGNKLDEQVAHGEEWAGSDFYEVIYNARNNKSNYKSMRSVMKRIMDRVATSSMLQVGFDEEVELGKVIDYADNEGLTGKLKISTHIHEGVQYVKIIFSPQGVKGAYNIGEVGYGFSNDIKLCCSRPVIKGDRDWQYTLGLNQGSDLTPQQVRKLAEMLLWSGMM